MNTPFYIARRFTSQQSENFSRPMVNIAIIGVALGLSVMIIAVSIVTGFQKQIRDKVIGFGAHLQINKYDFNTSYESDPISIHQEFYPDITNIKGVKHIQVYAYKAGIIKTYTEIQGIILKGVGRDYNWEFFKNNLTEGAIPDFNNENSNEILISQSIAKRLSLKTGDDLRMYFVSKDQENIRGRRFIISGVFKTGLEELDEQFVIGDIKQIVKLNRWDEDQVSGFEIILNNFDSLEKLQSTIYQNIGYDLNTTSVKDNYPQIFDWLELMDMNVIIILVLMILVASVTIISILLILILERTTMIGILKALGANNFFIRKIFLYKSLTIVGYGLIYGNIIGVGICLLQYYFGIIGLNQESYYMSVVPILLDPLNIIFINMGTAIIATFIMIVPSAVISKIEPIKAIRFN